MLPYPPAGLRKYVTANRGMMIVSSSARGRRGDQLGGSPPHGRERIVITYDELHRLLALPEGTEIVDAATFPTPHKGFLHVVYQPVTR